MLQQHLNVGLFLLFDLFLKGLMSVVTGPSVLEAYLGQPLCVKCQYEKGYHNYKKYWCRGSVWTYCKYVVMTDTSEEEKRDGRIAIKDNHAELEFTVRMENITEQDADIYWCAIERSLGDYKWEVNITVIPALPPTTTVGYFSTISTLPTEITEKHSNSDPDLMILLPAVLGVLMLILVGTILLMWKLRKKKAIKISKGIIPSMVSPSSNQTADGTELAYITVIPMSSSASKSQVAENTESVDYASCRFSALSDQPIYANT